MPAYHTKINELLYNKKQIIDTIAHNYKKDKKRNKYDAQSNVHHCYNDYDNPDFKVIDCSQLIPIYEQHITDFLNIFCSNYRFEFSIVNYTCYNKGQYFGRHVHSNSDFSAIHYIKFEKGHEPTEYWNPNPAVKFLNGICNYKDYKKIFLRNDPKFNTWQSNSFSFPTVEDDFIILHSSLEHSVSASKIDSLRMAIVLNIKIKEISEGD